MAGMSGFLHFACNWRRPSRLVLRLAARRDRWATAADRETLAFPFSLAVPLARTHGGYTCEKLLHSACIFLASASIRGTRELLRRTLSGLRAVTGECRPLIATGARVM